MTNLLKNKFELYNQLSLDDKTILNWDYWEFEMHIKFLNEKNKEENKRREEEQKQQQQNMPNMSKWNPSSMMRNTKLG